MNTYPLHVHCAPYHCIGRAVVLYCTIGMSHHTLRVYYSPFPTETSMNSPISKAEYLEKIRKVLADQPLCGRHWVVTDPDQTITNLCPISALLRAAGVPDADIIKLESKSPGRIYQQYGQLLWHEYRIDRRMFYRIVSRADNVEYDLKFDLPSGTAPSRILAATVVAYEEFAPND